jgi:type II restriction enzyme
MKQLDTYKKLGLTNDDLVFDYFFNTITPVIHNLSFYVNWEKVFSGVEKYKIELGILNSLCGSKDIVSDFKHILNKYPEVVQVFSLLIGVRGDKIQVLKDIDEKTFKFLSHNFKKKTKLTDEEIETYVLFFQETGLFNFIEKKGLQSLKDYSYGVEVGLDTNGRKNRGGTNMETLVKKLITPIVLLNDCEIIEQGTQKSVLDKWNLHLPLDKSNRIVDFVINKNGKLIWVETNFYSGGGSKLKSTSGEYKDLFNFCRINKIEFVWITDGDGWKTTKKPLRETFNLTDHILNLNMIREGCLEEILKKL